MRILICGFFGYRNSGDEAVLQSIMDQLGRDDNSYIVSTSLPFGPLWDSYRNVIGCEIRNDEDYRDDIDLYILGGGGPGFGYGWRQCLSMFANGVKCINYGVGYDKRFYYHEKMHDLYYEFLRHFDAITVRDQLSYDLLELINNKRVDGKLKVTLTFDPAILLEEKPFEKIECPKDKIVVFPRFEDGVSNQPQLDWLEKELKDICGNGGDGNGGDGNGGDGNGGDGNGGDYSDVILVPCASVDLSGQDLDLALCKYLNEKLEGSQILDLGGFEPRKMKYLIKQSRMVISGGRYHPVVWALGSGIPFKFSPTAFAYPKNVGLVEMNSKYGRDGLIELAKKNVDIVKDILI